MTKNGTGSITSVPQSSMSPAPDEASRVCEVVHPRTVHLHCGEVAILHAEGGALAMYVGTEPVPMAGVERVDVTIQPQGEATITITRSIRA